MVATRKKITKLKPEADESPLASGWKAAGTGEVEGPVPEDGFDKARVAFGKTEELVRLKVYRKCPDGVEEAMGAYEYDPDVHTEEFIRQTFGPGNYRLRFSDRGWKWIGSFSIRLGTPSLTPVSLGAAGTPDAGTPDGFDPVSYFMRDAEKSREQFNAMVLAMIGKSSGGGNESMVALIQSQSDQSARSEERNLVLLQKLLDRPGGAGVGTADTVLKALELGMTAVSDVKADAEGGWVTALRGVAKEIGPLLSQMMAQRKSAGTVPVVEVPTTPGPGPPVEPVAQVAAVGASNDSDVFRGLLIRYAPIALRAAKEGQPPVEFAGQILDSIGVNYHALFDSLQAHDLVSLQPELSSIKWVNPEDGDKVSWWVDEVVRLLHTRDWGTENEDGATENEDGA